MLGGVRMRPRQGSLKRGVIARKRPERVHDETRLHAPGAYRAKEEVLYRCGWRRGGYTGTETFVAFGSPFLTLEDGVLYGCGSGWGLPLKW